MQKKLVTLFLAITLVVNPVRCYAAGVWKLLTGIGLVGAGIFMVADGFRTIETIDIDKKDVWLEDISDPQLDISNWEWEKGTSPYVSGWFASGEGAIQNTGNVPISDIKLHFYVTDIDDRYLWGGAFFLSSEPYPLNPEEWDYWRDSIFCGADEPFNAHLEVVNYNYEKLYQTNTRTNNVYEKKVKSPVEGAIGIASIGTGIYLIIDYLVDYSKLKKEAGIEIKVEKRKDTLYLLCCKNF